MVLVIAVCFVSLVGDLRVRGFVVLGEALVWVLVAVGLRVLIWFALWLLFDYIVNSVVICFWFGFSFVCRIRLCDVWWRLVWLLFVVCLCLGFLRVGFAFKWVFVVIVL